MTMTSQHKDPRAVIEQLVQVLEKHHKQETRYSDNKRRANATCAHFTANPLQELAEQAYMLTHGKETIEAITAGRAALANAEQPVSINDDAFWSSAMKSINPISVDAEGLALWLDSFPRRWPELDQAAALLRAQAATAPQPAPKGEPVMFAWKRDDGTYYDASGTEHSCGMHPLFAHAEPAQQVPEGWMKWLKKMEWNNWRYDRYGDSKPHCPECGQEKEDGHKEDCELAAMLGAAPAAKL